MDTNIFLAFSLSINFKMSIMGTSFKHSNISSSLEIEVLDTDVISWVPSITFVIKSCMFNWFKKSTSHFNPMRNFLLSSWFVNFVETLFDSLYHDFGPNCTWPYLWALAAWIDDKFDLAEILFFNFLNKTSLLKISFLCFLLEKVSSLLVLSLSLKTIPTLPLSTPAFWTNVLNRFV